MKYKVMGFTVMYLYTYIMLVINSPMPAFAPSSFLIEPPSPSFDVINILLPSLAPAFLRHPLPLSSPLSTLIAYTFYIHKTSDNTYLGLPYST